MMMMLGMKGVGLQEDRGVVAKGEGRKSEGRGIGGRGV